MKWCVESHVIRNWWWRDDRRFWVAYRDDDDAETTDFDSWREAYDYALTEARSEKFQEVLDKIMSNPGTRAVLAALGRGPCDGCPSCDAEKARAVDICPPGVHSIFDPCPGHCTED